VLGERELMRLPEPLRRVATSHVQRACWLQAGLDEDENEIIDTLMEVVLEEVGRTPAALGTIMS